MAPSMTRHLLMSIAERLGFDLYDYWDNAGYDDPHMPNNDFLVRFIASRLFGVKSRLF